MDYVFEYNYCAILVYLIILFTHFLNKNTHRLHNRVFGALIIVGLVGTIINILNAYGNMHTDTCAEPILNFLNYAYFLCLNISPFLYAIYTNALTENKIVREGRFRRIILFLPILISILIIITNKWTNFVFGYNDKMEYYRGNLQFILYIVAIFYGIYGVVKVVRGISTLSIRIKVSVTLFFVMGLVTALIQLIDSRVLIQYFGLSICTMLIYLTIQKTDESVDENVGVFNKHSFDNIFTINCKMNNEMHLLLINIEELKLMSQTIGGERTNEILRSIGEFLEILSEKNVYFLDHYTFCIMYMDKNNINHPETFAI